MKRELYETVNVIPGGTGVPVRRTGFLSAVLGVEAGAEGTLEPMVEHADSADGEFTELGDPYAGVTGKLREQTVGKGDVVNIPIDLAGCKEFIRISLKGTAMSTSVTEHTTALVLGDPSSAPV